MENRVWDLVSLELVANFFSGFVAVGEDEGALGLHRFEKFTEGRYFSVKTSFYEKVLDAGG
jgi:hypothetical protein